MLQEHRLKAGLLSPLKTLPPCYGERVSQKLEGSWLEVFWTTLYLWNGGLKCSQNCEMMHPCKLILRSSEAQDCFLLYSGLFFFFLISVFRNSRILIFSASQFNPQSSKTNLKTK